LGLNTGPKTMESINSFAILSSLHQHQVNFI
jgi:hypothetical protein